MEEEKIVLNCLRCYAQLRIPEEKHITANCPYCRESFEANNGVFLNSFGIKFKTKFATFWQRLLARIIDVIVSSIIFGIFYLFIQSQIDILNDYKYQNVESFLGMCFYFLMYYPILESLGGTVGKKIIGIKSVLKSTLQTPTILETYIRSLFLISPLAITFYILLRPPFEGDNVTFNYIIITLSVFLLFVNLFVSPLAMLWSKTSQGWHDKKSDIIVVKNVKEIDLVLNRRNQTNYTFS
jgi:uncharacterized RDD family membrane protein YckC